MSGATILEGLMILVGLIGIVVPLLPGLLLVWATVLVWASEAQTPAGWVVLATATVLALSGSLLQYRLPSRRMAKAGVRTSSSLAGAVLGGVGFLVMPVVGAFLGFVVGVYLAERTRPGTQAAAWSSTRHALKAIVLSMGIELLTGVAVATMWIVGVATAG